MTSKCTDFCAISISDFILFEWFYKEKEITEIL